MAIREVGHNGSPQFEDPNAPLVQLLMLFIWIDDSWCREICTSQDDDEWGLVLHEDPVSELPITSGGIYRSRELSECPCGLVSDISVNLREAGNIRDVRIKLSGREIALVAGEVYEGVNESLRFVQDDESVLLFPDARDMDSVDWHVHRDNGEGCETRA